MTNCKHTEVILFGSEETGLRAAKCANCGVEMNRRRVDGEYVFVPRDLAEELSKSEWDAAANWNRESIRLAEHED